MKNIMKCAAIVAAITFSVNQSQAQESFFSAGLEVGLPMGDFSDGAGFGIGGSLGYELGLSDKLAFGANAGYTLFTGKDTEVSGVTVEGEASGMIPIQAYARYYFAESREGLFASLKTGLHLYSYDSVDENLEETTEFDAIFGLAPEIGFFLTENVSLALRYQMLFQTIETFDIDLNTGEITTSEETQTWSYIGLRAAYNF